MNLKHDSNPPTRGGGGLVSLGAHPVLALYGYAQLHALRTEFSSGALNRMLTSTGKTALRSLSQFTVISRKCGSSLGVRALLCFTQL